MLMFDCSCSKTNKNDDKISQELQDAGFDEASKCLTANMRFRRITMAEYIERKLNILIACEESQRVTIEFRKLAIMLLAVMLWNVPEDTLNGIYSKTFCH